MKRLFLLCCCLAAAVSLSARPGTLERGIRALTDSVRATVGIAVVFDDGDTLVVNGFRPYPMLSVFKFHMDSREDDRTNAAVIARISRLVYDYAARR